MSTTQTQAMESVLDPEEWVDAYGDQLFRYARTRLRDPNAAEEVVQETFLAGIHQQTQFLGTGSQIGWLMVILRRKIVDYIRRRSRHGHQLLDDQSDPTEQLFDENGRWKPGAVPQMPPDQPMESKELWHVVRFCLQGLPQEQADVFVLSVMEEMKKEEICKELSITTSTLWTRMHRARLWLAKCVGEKWFENDQGLCDG